MDNFIPKIVYGTGPTTVLFDFPPSADNDEQKEGIKRESISIAGTRQISLDRTEITRACTYKFVTKTLLDQIEVFFEAWGKYGKPFDYYVHNQNALSLVNYELKDLKFNPQRLVSHGADFYYTLTLTFRRFE